MTDIIINATQHAATPEQVEAGVVELQFEDKEIVKNLLTFNNLPTKEILKRRANEISAVISYSVVMDHCWDDGKPLPKVMIGGAPFFMSILERVLQEQGYEVVYAFSTRVSEEVMDDEGNVKKVSSFKHLGFV